MREIHSATELGNTLCELPLVGRRITSIDIIGRLRFADRGSMIDFYNSAVRRPGEPYRLSPMPIYQDEIPLAAQRTRLISTDGPLIVGLDDGSALELTMTNASCAFVDFERVAEHREGKGLVNVSGILRPILGETITCVEVQNLSSDTQEWDYVDSAFRDDPFRMCMIRCEDHLLWASWIDTMVLTNGEKPQAMEMTMGEWKDCVSYYADLFDKRGVEDTTRGQMM